MKKLLSLHLAIAIALISVTANADDTEIFTGTASSGGGADILFIVDTSGSMAELEFQEGESYDPDTVYPGRNYNFEADGYYLFKRSAFYSSLDELSSAEISRLKEYQVDISAYNCTRSDTLESLDKFGYASGRYAFYTPGQEWSGPDSRNGGSNSLWRNNRPTVNNSANSIIQCQEAGGLSDWNYWYQGVNYRGATSDSNTFNPYTTASGWTWWRHYAWSNYEPNDGYYDEIYSGNYLNYLRDKKVGGGSDTGYKMRMDIVIDAAKEVILSNDDPNKRLALMRFSSDGSGGYVSVPMAPIQEIGDAVADAITSFHPGGGTPIAETLYEANQYLTEGAVGFGKEPEYITVDGYFRRDNYSEPWQWYADRYKQTFSADNYPGKEFAFATNGYSENNTQSDPGSVSGSIYSYPESGMCGAPNQKVIIFSDGQPTGDDEADGSIKTLANSAWNYPSDTSNPGCKTYGSGDNKVTSCLPALAWYMHHPKRREDQGLPELTIDTIGGFLNADSTAEPILSDIANYGGGQFYPVASEEEVKVAMAEALRETKDSASTFTAPAIAVSSYNSLQISDELYYAVFKPNDTGAWRGNLKRYRVSNDGVVDSTGDGAIGTDGYFKSGAISFWSSTEDGADVEKGGVAERLGDKPRNIKLIDSNGNLIQATTDNVLGLSGDLLGLEAAGLTGSIFDATNNVSYELGLANWISGLKPDGSGNRLEMEDAIHSRPVVVNYSNSQRIVYIGTNSGYLHAFDTANGREVFSIIPQEVLPNARFYMDPSDTTALSKIYGLDGPITYWHNDINLNGIVDDSDTVYLYVGMRRGGATYYAFDITNPSSPSLLWQVNGNYVSVDKNIPSLTSGYERLGQTWSSLKPALVNWNGQDKVVLFAGGGYDTVEDSNAGARISHSIGNTIYMIDATTGSRLWSAYDNVTGVSSDMTNSFAGDVTPVDRDGDGYVDLLYAADTGGRVWRFDAKSDNSGFSGSVLADLNGGSANTNRRFFVAPDVANIKTTEVNEVTLADGSTDEQATASSFILVNIGSGNRTSPLSEQVDDAFYMIRDTNGIDNPTSYASTVTASDLKNFQSSDALKAQNSPYGWYFAPSSSGEKILSPSITLNGVITFNTFSPQGDSSIASCSGDIGFSRTYQLAVSEEIRNRINCSDGTDSCKPEIPGEDPTPRDALPRMKPDPTIVIPNPDPCPEGETCEPSTCSDYAIKILSGTTLTESNMDRCDLFETNYWEELR